MIKEFLLGVIAALSFTAGLFFVRFWRETRDSFFWAFALFFMVEGVNRVALLFMSRPNEGSPWIYVVRLATLLIILAAILHKNYGPRS
ncbi:MAG: DUF5985 family protein [Terriglobales bacterium]